LLLRVAVVAEQMRVVALVRVVLELELGYQ